MTSTKTGESTTPMGTAAARMVGGSKVYGTGDTEVRALDGVDVEFERGRFTAIMGPSGSGKSTLMHCSAGLDDLTSGFLPGELTIMAARPSMGKTSFALNIIRNAFQAAKRPEDCEISLRTRPQRQFTIGATRHRPRIPSARRGARSRPAVDRTLAA